MLDDELDERDGTEGPATSKLPITYIFDIRDLEAPKLTGFYEGKTRSIDHNQYIVDGYNYQCKLKFADENAVVFACRNCDQYKY